LVIVPPAPTPAPTAARPAETDPNAPVVTRPQPLD
jgi:Meckel syndrome type 1 protein